MSRIRRLSKEGAWILLGQSMTVVASLILVRTITEYLDPIQYGQLALGLTIASFVSTVLTGGAINAISRYYSIAAEKNDLFNYFRASRKLMGYSSLGVFVISILIIVGLFALGYLHWVGLAVAALAFSLVSSYNSACSGIQNAARQRAISAIHGGFDGWLKIFFAVGAIFLLGNTSTAVVIGYALSSMLVLSSQIFFLRRLVSSQRELSNEDNHWDRRMWLFSWPFLATNAFGWAQQSSANWALDIYATTKDVGLYSVVSQLGYSPIQIVSGIFMTFLAPILFAKVGDASYEDRNSNVRSITNKIALLGIALSFCAFSLAMLLHTYIFELCVNEHYWLASKYLPYMVLSGGLFGAAQIYAIRIQALLMMDKLVSSGILISILGIILSFMCIRIAGLKGAVFASLIFSISYLILMMYWFFRKS